MLIQLLAMASALHHTLHLPCLTHYSLLYGSMHSTIAGPLLWSEPWPTILAGQPVPGLIDSCISACYGCLLCETLLKLKPLALPAFLPNQHPVVPCTRDNRARNAYMYSTIKAMQS